MEESSPLLGTSHSNIQRPKKCFPYRYQLAVLNCLGYAIAIASRYNFTIALVDMVNYTSTDNYTSDECPAPASSSNSTHVKEGDFFWNAHEQSLLLGGFFYGYVLTQILGGYLAEEIGPKLILLVTVLVPSLINLITPVLADWSVIALFISRIVMGIAQGPLYPANSALWSRWAPAQEKTTLFTVSQSGGSIGSVTGPLITGFLCELSFLRGWPLSFYLFGLLGLVWSVLWFLFAHNSPETHTSLSPQERDYILRGRSFTTAHKTLRRPWRSMFTSRAVWAVFLFGLFDGLAFYSIASGVPIYMRQILRFNISENGVLLSAPYVATFFMIILSGVAADFLQKKGLSTRTTRNIFTVMGEGSQVFFIIGMGFLPCSRVAAVSLYIAAMVCVGFTSSGPNINFLDIAPKYAGTLMGLCNFLGNIGGFVSPLVIGAITKESPDRKDWQTVFFLTAGAYAMATLLFVILSKGEEEPWAKDNVVTMVTNSTENGTEHLHVSVNSGDRVDSGGRGDEGGARGEII